MPVVDHPDDGIGPKTSDPVLKACPTKLVSYQSSHAILVMDESLEDHVTIQLFETGSERREDYIRSTSNGAKIFILPGG